MKPEFSTEPVRAYSLMVLDMLLEVGETLFNVFGYNLDRIDCAVKSFTARGS